MHRERRNEPRISGTMYAFPARGHCTLSLAMSCVAEFVRFFRKDVRKKQKQPFNLLARKGGLSRHSSISSF